MSFRVVVAGLGVQGEKRRAHAGADCVATVEPRGGGDYADLTDVPAAAYDAAILCTPDAPKTALLRRLIAQGKHALVEKPLFAAEDAEIAALERAARAAGVLIRTAYNHRFEPHVAQLRGVIRSGRLGALYRCRMFYGNGTARLVRESPWRDQGAGVVSDLGSHLLDMAAFWFGEPTAPVTLRSAAAHETRAPDHAILAAESARPALEMEMTLLSWRNHFSIDLIGEKGSAHISSLCKWGPSTLTLRQRVSPAGRPPEESLTRVEDDPTWALEYAAFRADAQAGVETDLGWDLRLNRLMRQLGAEAEARVRAAK